jgi:hypothetical protein
MSCDLHINIFEFQVNKTPCMHCSKTFNRRDRLLEHTKKCHPTAPKCFHCGCFVLRQKDLRKHLTSSCTMLKPRLKCKLCGKFCYSIPQHMILMHPTAETTPCPKCTDILHVTTLQNHPCLVKSVAVNLDVTASCPFCGLLANASEKEAHFQALTCEECGMWCPCVTSYEYHVCPSNNKEKETSPTEEILQLDY